MADAVAHRSGTASFSDPTGRLDRAAFDLVGNAISVDDHPDIDRRSSGGLTRISVRRLDLGHDGAVGARILIARDSPCPRPWFSRFGVCPSRTRSTPGR